MTRKEIVWDMEPYRVDHSPARSIFDSGLLIRQEEFCLYYVQYPDAARAARLAGYSPRYAKQSGYRLLRMPKIWSRIRDIKIEIGLIEDDNAPFKFVYR